MDFVSNDVSLKISEFLLQIKAVQLSPSEPFTWASGWKSPIYCDNRKTLSFPKIRTFIRQELSNAVKEKYGSPELIAGVATGAIAQGALVAEDLGLPFVYVRSKPKGHGLTNMIEGYYEKNQDVVVIEDLISTGKSSLTAVKALREAGCNVKGMVGIFTYGFDVAEKAFKEANCPLITLTNYSILIKHALEIGFITEDKLETLHEWRSNPDKWMQ